MEERTPVNALEPPEDEKDSEAPSEEVSIQAANELVQEERKEEGPAVKSPEEQEHKKPAKTVTPEPEAPADVTPVEEPVAQPPPNVSLASPVAESKTPVAPAVTQEQASSHVIEE